MTRPVTALPARPEKGESLAANTMLWVHEAKRAEGVVMLGHGAKIGVG